MPNKNISNSTPEKDEKFKGYSIEELRYQRALLALRKEFCKSKVMHSLAQIRIPKKETSSSSGFLGTAGKVAGIAGKIFSNLNLLDYAMVGASLFGSGKKIYKLMRRK